MRPYLANVNVRWGEFILDDLREMRFESDEMNRYGLKYGDIVMCEGGEPGRSAIWKEPVPGMMIQKALHRIRPHDCVEYRFLYYSLMHKTDAGHLASLFTGSTIKHLPREKLAKVEVQFPSRAVQVRISDILSAYDDLIENNTRRIQVLKDMAKTILQSATADSWSLIPISGLYEELFDGPHATPKPSTSGPIYLGIKNVTERGELDLTDIRHIADEDFPQWTRRVLPRPGDIVFTYEATLNRYGIISRGFRGCLGRRMALIRPDEKRIDPYLFLHCLLSDQWRDEVRSKTISGATVDRIPLTTFPTFQVRVPGPDIRARIGPPIRACEELAENCRRRNDLLRTTRDLLLPKLVSGEIPIEAAELTEQLA